MIDIRKSQDLHSIIANLIYFKCGYSNRQTGRTKDLPGIVRPQWYLDMDADSILMVVGVVEGVVEVVVV